MYYQVTTYNKRVPFGKTGVAAWLVKCMYFTLAKTTFQKHQGA
jgi:hypothetical protein